MMYSLIGIGIAVVALLLRSAWLARQTRQADARDAEWAVRKFQLETITEAAKKKAVIDAETEAEKAKLPDMSNAELERKVNE